MTKSNTIQDKMDALNAMVAWFDSDEFVLEQATERFKAAEQLATEITQELAAMKNEIVVLKQRFDETE